MREKGLVFNLFKVGRQKEFTCKNLCLDKQRIWISKCRLPRQPLVREVSAAASVGASAFGRGVHRTPAPLIPRRNGDIYGKRDFTEIYDI